MTIKNTVAWKFFILFCAMFSLLSTTPSSAESLTLITEDYKPFQYRNVQGKLEGFGIELVSEIMKRAGVDVAGGRILMLPWARGYTITQKKADAALFMTVRTAKREQLFKWVGPLAPRAMYLYKHATRKDVQVNDLDQAKGYRVGGYKNSADTNYMLELGFDVKILSHQKQITRMLVNDRLDLISSLEPTMAQRLRDLGLSQDMVEKTVLLDGRYDYYLALNPAVSDGLVQRLQRALEAIREDGTYHRLWNQYVK